MDEGGKSPNNHSGDRCDFFSRHQFHESTSRVRTGNAVARFDADQTDGTSRQCSISRLLSNESRSAGDRARPRLIPLGQLD